MPKPNTTQPAAARPTPAAKAPAKTQAQRRTEARAKILGAALTCFREQGYSSTSMAQIAKTAGVSPGLLHYHFDNKENLAFAVWRKAAEDVFESITSRPRELDPTREAIGRLADELWQEVRQVALLAPMSAQLFANAFDSPATQARIGELFAEQRRLLATGIDMLVAPTARGMPHDATEIADMMMVVLSGLLNGLALPASAARTDRLYGIFRRMLLDYFLPDSNALKTGGPT